MNSNPTASTPPQSSPRSSRLPHPVAWASSGGYVPPRRHIPIDLKLDSNEGPLGDNFLLEPLPANLLRAYPSKRALEARLAQLFRITSDRVLVTCGGDDGIDRICRAFLEPGRELILPEPTFEMIGQYARMAGATIRSIPWPTGPFPTQGVLEAVSRQTAVISIVSPNNPTGGVARVEDLKAIASACPDAVLLVDLAYVEFADPRYDLTRAALEIPSAVVIRTFSKAWGLAGLRVGYALGSPELIQVLWRAGSPYPVSGPSAAIAAAALEQLPHGRREYIAAVQEERQELAGLLRELGAAPVPSQGNFVFCRFRDADFVHDGLAAVGIGVRSFSALPGCLRITCPGNPRDFDRLCRALRAVLAPQALLFDMDGVLADEAPSYREAIRQTCSTFGQEVSMARIAARKLAGNSNNDWDFTYHLLLDLGAKYKYEEVKQRFESIYQGTDGYPGLWRQERLLVDPAWLRSLSQQLPLAIVTGRPRGDATRFLVQHNILDCFRTLVCMEDGPVKPNPAPVARALRELGVRDAWMLGDTPDDMNAARAAGVIPLAVVAPADDRADAHEKLNAAAAVRILEQTTSLTSLLNEITEINRP